MPSLNLRKVVEPSLPGLLVVDDDLGLLRLMERILARAGYRVSTASSGKAAMAWLAQNTPDLLLLDLKLRDIEGPALINQITALNSKLAFIIITGQGDERVAVEMMKRGAHDYLVKDANFLELLPTIVARTLQQIEKERKLVAAEEAFRKEHDFVTALLRTSGALVVVLDRDGRVIHFNPACERATGYSFEEVRGKHIWDTLIISGELTEVKRVFERLCSGELHNRFENYWQTRDGDKRLIAWSNAVLSGADGKVEYIIGTGLDITERKRLEQEILQISEMEQQRIGQDLHDGLCQHLAGIEFMSQVLEQRLSAKAKSEAVHAAEIAKLVRQAISDTRNLARGLSPVVEDAEGLMLALQELAANTEKLFKTKCTFRCPETVLVTDNSTATHLFRIAQEAVSNALRHGKATTIEIVLTHTPERTNLMVKDNGCGLPRTMPKKRGMGLRIMRYRAGMIGGSLALQKGNEGGTTVVCTVHKKSDKIIPVEER